MKGQNRLKYTELQRMKEKLKRSVTSAPPTSTREKNRLGVNFFLEGEDEIRPGT